MGIKDSGNRARIAALRNGDKRAIAQFLNEIAPAVWTACSLLTAEDSEARQAFVETIAKLRADDFALLTQYTGRGTLESFAALASRDLLADRVQRLLAEDPKRGWHAFEAFFKADLQRLIHRRLPGGSRGEVQRDAYQSICLAMIDSDYRRLKAYSGSGSFAGFVLRTADRLLIDFLRSTNAGRRLQPVWDTDLLEIPDAAEASPEAQLVQAEEDRQLAAAVDVLRRAMETLPEAERLYLSIALGATQMPPSREIARLMQRAVEDIYKLRQRVLNRLRDVIADDSAVKNWRASV
jgi:RNA polymerase sigma factor (sigma-70 family)